MRKTYHKKLSRQTVCEIMRYVGSVKKPFALLIKLALQYLCHLLKIFTDLIRVCCSASHIDENLFLAGFYNNLSGVIK